MNKEEYLKELKKYLRRLPSEDYKNAMDYFTEYFDEAGPEKEAHVIAELGTPKEAASELLCALLAEKTMLPAATSVQKQESSDTDVIYEPTDSSDKIASVHNSTPSDGEHTRQISTEIISREEGQEEKETTQKEKTHQREGTTGRYRYGDALHSDSKKDSPLSVLAITCLAICAAPIGLPIAFSLLLLLLCGVIVLASGILCVFIFGFAGALIGAKLLFCGITAITTSISGACLLIGSGLLVIGLGVLIFFLGYITCKWIGLSLVRFIQNRITKRSVKNREEIK